VNDDADLITETLAGNRAAFGALVRRHQGRLFNTLVHVVGSREDAEDIAQEAFVQAFMKLGSFRGHSAFYTWLYRIAFNVAVSRRRRKRAEVSMEVHRERTGFEPAETGEEPEERLQREEQLEQVRGAIGRLTDEHRAMIVLRDIEGCRYEMIAEILELPVGTVRSRLHRARLQLREALKELFQTEHRNS
jgi:RNA polymerase sigma-70 factor (ECF subfamily)